ncbi:MAG: hypothetical protein GC154_16965 [bacterium]|nr:hypothetical protein [bacterium]
MTMIQRVILSLALIGIGMSAFAQVDRNEPERLARKDSFFGLHYDFHAGAGDNRIGEHVTREMVEAIIDSVHPDFIQIDCKGHPGYSSYPTQAGNQAGGFVKDALKIWREVTAERGVALYMHYSGVIDQRACELHPEWRVIGADGNPSDRVTSVFSSYADDLLIPQFKELSSVYHVDGVWVDGECWGTERDWGETASAQFRKETGIEDIPKSPDEPNWFEWSQFNRDAFRRYLMHYVSSLHDFDPKFQIASNWAYSSFMPEEVTTGVDFISGDFSPLDGVNTARLEGRVMARQGKPWDLMAWGFTWIGGKAGSQVVKSATQLQQEAAIVLSQAGGFQMYMKQRRDASIYEWTLPVAAGVAEFCRARQPWCQYAQSVPQIGLVLSTDAFYRKNRKPFGAWSGELNALQGVLHCLLNSQNVVDVVMEHTLKDNIDQYGLLVYPEWETITPKLKADLLGYVERGGALLVIGPRSAALFEDDLDVKLTGEARVRDNGLQWNGMLASTYSLSQDVELGETAKAFGAYFDHWEDQGPQHTAASITPYGKGKLAAIYLNLGERYQQAAATVNREFVKAMADTLFPQPMVRVTGSHYVDVTLNRKNGNLNLHLINTAGEHENEKVYVYDEIPFVGPIHLEVRMDKKPKSVTLQPQNKALKYRYRNGVLRFTLPRLELYDIVVIEEG